RPQRNHRQHGLAWAGRDRARPRLGGGEPREAHAALSGAAAGAAGRYRARGRAARLATFGLDHRPDAQHQRRLQHGVTMLHAELIAPIHLLLERHAAARGAKIAYRDAHGAVSYAALRERTGNLAGHLAALGVGEKETVAILLPNGVT